jgi:hypothetical protein
VFTTLKEISTQAIAAIDRDLGCTIQLVAIDVGSMPSEEPESADVAPLALETSSTA